MRLHLVQSSRSSSNSPFPTLSCSQGTCRHSVFKKVHLTFSSPLQTILEAVDSSCINIILGQAVPAVDHSLRKEVKTAVTATTFVKIWFSVCVVLIITVQLDATFLVGRGVQLIDVIAYVLTLIFCILAERIRNELNKLVLVLNRSGVCVCSICRQLL